MSALRGTPEHIRRAALPGIGPALDAVIMAKIGGVTGGCGPGLAVLPGWFPKLLSG